MGKLVGGVLSVLCFTIGGTAFALPDPALVATWDYKVPVMSIFETMIFFDDTHMSDKNVMGGTVFNDIDGTYEVDQSVEPHRLVITVTRSNPSQLVQAPPGSKFFCIYRVKGNMMNFNCADPNVEVFPVDFYQALAFTKR
jgi:hypothetical protein